MEQKESIGRLISSTHRHICIYLDSEFRAFGIGSGQVPVLRALQVEDGINQEKLASMFRVNKATTARAIEKLVKEGYVVKKRDEADNRAYKIYLTKKGQESEPKLRSTFKQLTDILSTGLTEQERKTAMRLLEKMTQNILVANEKTGKTSNERSD